MSFIQLITLTFLPECEVGLEVPHPARPQLHFPHTIPKLFEVQQRAVTIREVTGVQNLNSSLMITIKCGDRVAATCVRGICRIREPDP